MVTILVLTMEKTMIIFRKITEMMKIICRLAKLDEVIELLNDIM